jgi:hypothetical protein
MVSGRHGAIRGVLAEIRGFDVFERLRGWGKIILKWVARLRANDNKKCDAMCDVRKFVLFSFSKRIANFRKRPIVGFL